MTLFENEVGMEPGDVLLRQLKAKFPPKKKAAGKGKEKKVKKMKKKVKKVKMQVPEEDLGLESSGSSGSSPSSSTLASSRDSGHASDSNSASRDSEDTNGDSKEIKNSPQTSPKTAQKVQKLSSRVAFFENAIKTAAVTTVSRKEQDQTPTRRLKDAKFLRAENEKCSPVSPPIGRHADSAEYSDSTSSSEETFNDAVDPAVEEPKLGTLFLSERDLKMEKKLIKQVAGEIEENGVGGVKKILRKKMNKWKSESLNIAIMGDSLSGKSSVISALGGLLASPNKFTGRLASCHQPTECKSALNDSLSIWELPPVSMSGKYSKVNYLRSVEAQRFDVFLLCTPTWFKSHQIAVAEQLAKEHGRRCIFVRTKLDDSIINDRKSRPNSHDEEAVMHKVRNHCLEPLERSAINHIKLYLISAFHLNKYDGPKLLSCLLNELDQKDKKNKFSALDAMTMSLPASSLEIIYRKRELLLERIWKVASISTVSGIMPISGYNLTADIELLQKEIRLYRTQFGVTDKVLEQSSNCPNMVPVWKLLCDGNGLQSLLRQSAMDQQWEEFSKFMNKLPLIGGNVSFAATCSVLK